jgi:hypothetical protein
MGGQSREGKFSLYRIFALQFPEPLTNTTATGGKAKPLKVRTYTTAFSESRWQNHI